MSAAAPYTVSTAFLEALAEAGVEYVFANLGSDHPGLIEAYAQARGEGTEDRFPELIICPHESVALSAAQGYAQTTGRMQAVIVHVECGTQNLGGMLHNAARGRVPVLVFAGSSPATQHGEFVGSRNEFIHWIQDVHDQRGIVRGYTKYDNEIRTGANVKQLVHRAAQIATSDPAGPVYLMAAREVMERELDPDQANSAYYALGHYGSVEPGALPPHAVEAIGTALVDAERPVIVTSYLGREPRAVAELRELADLLAIRVVESAPMRMNFPADHPLHAGFQWNTTGANPVLAAADTVLVLDSDVPWIPITNGPADSARVFVVDVDPIKEGMSLWHVPAELFARADGATAVRQLADHAAGIVSTGTDFAAERRSSAAAERARRHAELLRAEEVHDGTITAEYVVGCLREALSESDEDNVVLTESISNYEVAGEHLRRDRPGSLLGSGGSSLGWHAGAAIGVKFARPRTTVVSLVGDGTYLFGVPASAQWVAAKYGAPSLTVILDNQGWNAPKLSTLAVHPNGRAARRDDFNVSFQPEADLPGVAAAAGGAWARTVDRADDLPSALRAALTAVRSGRSAVLSARLSPVEQPADVR